jgi:hypothetical protein
MITNHRRNLMPPVRRSARLGGLLVAALVVASVAAGCTSGASASIKVTDAWARAATGMGAAYMTIQNTGSAADALVGASSPAAKTTEVHETVVMGSPDPSASAAPGDGMMGMRPIARLEIPAGGTVELKPGSYHVMLVDLTQELKAGDKIEITLKFEKAGEVKVTAEVRES